MDRRSLISLSRSRVIAALGAALLLAPALAFPPASAADEPVESAEVAAQADEAVEAEPDEAAAQAEQDAADGSARSGSTEPTGEPRSGPTSTNASEDGPAEPPEDAAGGGDPTADADVKTDSAAGTARPRRQRVGAPQAVGDATIRVFKGGDRESAGCSPTTTTSNCRDNPATGLPGAEFAAYARGSSQTNSVPSGAPVATCTTDAAGLCDLHVDSALGPRYVVVETAAPAGWRKIDQVALGGAFDSGTPRAYRWNVGVRSGSVTVVPETEIRNVTGQDSWGNRRSSPTDPDYQWADARDNVPLPAEKCGLDVAMLFDLSGSIGGNLPLVKSAANEFVDDLTGTPTNIALFTFSTQSPQNNGDSKNRPNLVSIADPADATRVKGWINGFSGASGGTNWDAGLRRVAAAEQYDVLIVLTDGNPTAWEGDTSTTSDINDYDVESAVHSANWVKATGTRIVAIGLSGERDGLTPLNLQHISGPVKDDDYYLTTFGDLADVLTKIALNGCGGTINVQKRIAPSFGAATTVSPEPNWPFSIDPDQRYVTPRSGTTGPNGEPLTFRVTFGQGELARDVTISEPPNEDSTVLVQDAGKNARCFLRGQPLPADRLTNEGDFGFTVADVTDQEIISCVVVDSDAQLQAVKYEDQNGNGVRDQGEPPLEDWEIFLDDNGNSQPDQGERLLATDENGEVLFRQLDFSPESSATYRVCEVLQDGWFNTEPGGGVTCREQEVFLGDSPAGPVEFGNVQAGGFTITKALDDETGLVPDDTEYTVEVDCTPADQLGGVSYPTTLALTDGETATVGPLIDGTTCDITETDAAGASSDIQPQSSVSIPDDDGVEIVVENTYPAGFGEVVKIVDGPLAGELAPEGTEFSVEVTCTYPDGFPGGPGTVPGFDGLELTIESGSVGQPGPAVEFGPLPVGSECTAVESDENGADPFGVTPGSVTITEPGAEPVQFVASNTYRPAALRINKVVDGPGAAFVPPDTVYVADVVCTFLGETTFDDQVEFGVNDPGIVSGQPVAFPVGTECTVTEADSQGATWSPASQTVELVGPDDPVLVDVTITNTFEAGELTVTKAIDDSDSGVVPPGVEYTINVACTFDGSALPGYPEDVVLTTQDDLSETLTGLPYGTECVLSEPDLNGAQGVTFTPSNTVTIDEDDVSAEVIVTNEYLVGTFLVTKEVAGPGGQFLPAETDYVLEVSCEYPEGFPATGAIPGFDPLELILSAPAGDASAIVGPLPVGATCTIDETDDGGAGSSTVVPDTVTVEEGSQTTGVVVTNTYEVGTFSVTKVVAGLGANFVPIDTEYTVEVSCSYPSDFPDSGPIPGFDPLTVVLKAPSAPDDRTAMVGPLPVGSECTISEPDPNGAGSVEIDPRTVTVAEGDERVDVTVTNTYPVGYGEVVKVATGPLAGQLAPEGTVFLVEVSCAFPPGFPARGDVPGYSPRELAIESGPPGQPGIPTEFGPLPVGSTCSVVETETNGAQPVDVSPPGGTEGLITIADSAEEPDPVQVTVTNTFNPAALLIKKELTGPGAALLPSDTEFEAGVVCTFEGRTTFDGAVTFSVDNPGAVTNQPEGATCTITETETNGAPTPPPQTVVLDPPPDPVVKEVTFVNEIPAGQLLLKKDVAGGAAGAVPDGVEFTAVVACTFQGSALPGYPLDVTLRTPDQLSETLTGLPIGTECFVTETDDGGATSVEFDPPAGPDDPTGQSGVVTVTEDLQQPVSVTVRNVFDPAVLRIFKDVQPEDALVPPGQIFTAFVECTFDGESIYSGDVPFGVGSPGLVSGLIVGSECTITEAESQGATFEPTSQTVVVEGPGDPVTVDVTITNTFEVGSLMVEKAVVDPSGLLEQGAEYTINVDCVFADLQLPGYPLDVVLTYPDDLSESLTGLPFGTECALSEPDLNGADSVTFEPGGGTSAQVTIDEESPSAIVTATNTYPAGTFPVIKRVVGGGATFVPTDTAYEVTATCTLPVDFPGSDPEPYVVTLTDGETQTIPPAGSLPVGTTCAVEETDSAGAGSSTVSPGEVVVAEGDQDVEVVEVTNSYPVASFPVTKVIAGPGEAFVPPGTAFTVSVTCAYPDGHPSTGEIPGFDPLLVTLTTPDELAGSVGPLPTGSRCVITETESSGASSVTVEPATVTVGEGDGPVEVTVTNTFEVGSLVIEKVIDGPASQVTGAFEFEVACTYLGVDLPAQSATVTPPATSVTVEGLPIGAECTVTELAPYGGADGPGVVDPGSVVIGEGDPVSVTVTNTFTPPPIIPPEPPQPPKTGASALPGMLAGGAGLVLLGMLTLVASRRLRRVDVAG